MAVELRIRALTNLKNKQWLGKKKADSIVCAFAEFYEKDKDNATAKCSRCMVDIVYEKDVFINYKDKLKKNATLLCPWCAFISSEKLDQKILLLSGICIYLNEWTLKNIKNKEE